MKKIYNLMQMMICCIAVLMVFSAQTSFAQSETNVTVDPAEYFESLLYQRVERPVFYPFRGELAPNEMHVLDTLTNDERRIIEEAFDPIAIGVVRYFREPIIFDLALITVPEYGETSIFGGRLSRMNPDTLVYTTYFRSTGADELRIGFVEGYFPDGVQVNIFQRQVLCFSSGRINRRGE